MNGINEEEERIIGNETGHLNRDRIRENFGMTLWGFN